MKTFKIEVEMNDTPTGPAYTIKSEYQDGMVGRTNTLTTNQWSQLKEALTLALEAGREVMEESQTSKYSMPEKEFPLPVKTEESPEPYRVPFAKIDNKPFFATRAIGKMTKSETWTISHSARTEIERISKRHTQPLELRDEHGKPICQFIYSPEVMNALLVEDASERYGESYLRFTVQDLVDAGVEVRRC